MKHYTDELVALSQCFYPKSFEPRPNDTDEHRRLLEVQAQSAREVGRFRDMLARLGAQFPTCFVDDRVYAIPTLMNAWDVCYPGKLILPTIMKDDGEHSLAFLVSNLAPYYMIHRVRFFYQEPQVRDCRRRGDRDCPADRAPENFVFTPEEQPYTDAIASEIEATFGYEVMPPDVGAQLVPGVSRRLVSRREATLYDCLFTDQIW